MKKLTLNQTWKYCLAMWEWIAEQVKKDNSLSVVNLKEQWLGKNGFLTDMYWTCFFCEYCEKDCGKCPGTLIDKKFDCFNEKYHWNNEPIKFYQKLLALNKKRLRKGKK